MTDRLQYIYTLSAVNPEKAASRDAWTDDDHETFNLHWANLERLKADGSLILAGRALDPDGSGPAIVVIEVDTEAQAQRIFLAEPFVIRGFATATLHPFRVAISRYEE